MKRRDFFKLGARKAAHVAYKTAGARAAQRARNWLRPPFALPELDFLIACTRCDACVEACPHGVLFPLPVRLGVQVAGSPAMDLLAKGCHMCEDWPCVSACEPSALSAPDSDSETPPKFAVATIVSEFCLPYSGPECGACDHVCPVPGALEWHAAKPAINQDLCSGCAMCREACIVEPKAVAISAVPPDEEACAT